MMRSNAVFLLTCFPTMPLGSPTLLLLLLLLLLLDLMGPPPRCLYSTHTSSYLWGVTAYSRVLGNGRVTAASSRAFGV
jgi:hypothetical protein